MNYIRKHHQWIIGSLIAVVIPLSVYFFQHLDSLKSETKKFYYSSPISATGQDEDSLHSISCWTSAFSSNRRDAYRCVAENTISDPCFTLPNSDSIVSCPEDPHDQAYYNVEGSLPREELGTSTSSRDGYPWYVVLSDGSECRFITGATALIGDMRLDYGCDGDGKSLLLPIIETDGLMKINCYSDKGVVSSCGIREAWF